MPSLPWHALDPARSLPPDDPRYIPRPWGGGDHLATLIRHGLTPIAVTGPSGSGKTTELRRAAGLLGDDIHGVDVPIDLLVGPDDLRPDLVLWELSQFLIDDVLSRDPDAQPSRALIDDLRASDPRLPRGQGFYRRPVELAELVLAEVRVLTGRSRVALLLDGLDGASEESARVLVRALLSLQHDADLVVVVPPALAQGPDSHDIVTHMRVFWLPSIPTDDPSGLRYLRRLIATRLGLRGLPKGLGALVDRAAEQSGGVTRIFLHLVQDAALFAEAAGRSRPTEAALDAAVRDRADAMRRLLIAGDLDALAAARDTDGLEVPADRKVRLLSHNALLEYPRDGFTVVRPHPLLIPLLARRGLS